MAYRSTPVDSHLRSPREIFYQCALCTTVPQMINHQDPHVAAKCERLEDYVVQSASNHDHTGCHKKALLHAGQTVSVLNNDRILWLPSTVVCAADHGSYIIKVLVELSTDKHQTTFMNVSQMLSNQTCLHPKVEVVEHAVSTSLVAAKQAVSTAAVKAPSSHTAQPSVAPAIPKQAIV